MLDSKENDDGGNIDITNTYLQLATTEKHRKFREQADKRHRQNAEKMQVKFCKS